MNNGFERTLPLSYSHGNHYDAVYPASALHSLTICQSIVYDIVDRALGFPESTQQTNHVYKNIELECWWAAVLEQQKDDQMLAQALSNQNGTVSHL